MTTRVECQSHDEALKLMMVLVQTNTDSKAFVEDDKSNVVVTNGDSPMDLVAVTFFANGVIAGMRSVWSEVDERLGLTTRNS